MAKQATAPAGKAKVTKKRKELFYFKIDEALHLY